MTWPMHPSRHLLCVFGLLTVVAAVPAGCFPVERNSGVCCTTAEDCAALGVDGPEGWECASGQVCIRNACVATECQASSDCSADAPVCSPDQRCVECIDSSDCGGRACDPSTNTCGECLTHGECASGVCLAETGVCADASSVVYAAPGAPSASDCLQDAPCSIKTALTIASTHPERSIVLMAPGVYAADLEVVGGSPITIIGDAATVTGGIAVGLLVSGGADVTVHGLTINAVETLTPIRCSTSSGPRTKLRLRGLSVLGIPTQGFYASSSISTCEVVMDQVTMRQHDLGVHASKIVIERSRLLNVGQLVGSALRVFPDVQGPSSLTMVNSVISGGLWLDGNQTINVSFSTIYGCEGPAYTILGCNRGVEWKNSIGSGVSFRNNVISGQMIADSVSCPSCSSLQASFVNNIIFPQSAAVAGNFVVSPQLVNPANHDFRLRPGSPAIDAADAVTTDHDLTGAARPVGPRADLGAYEFAP